MLKLYIVRLYIISSLWTDQFLIKHYGFIMQGESDTRQIQNVITDRKGKNSFFLNIVILYII